MSAMASQSPACRWFAQEFVLAQIKENIKASRHWLLEGNSLVTGEFPQQRASNAKNVSIRWRHHVVFDIICKTLAYYSAAKFKTSNFTTIQYGRQMR